MATNNPIIPEWKGKKRKGKKRIAELLIKGPLDGLVHPTSAVKFVASEIPIRSSMSKQYGGYMALNWF